MITPDFQNYLSVGLQKIEIKSLGIEILWKDGIKTAHLAKNLREFSEDHLTTHPITREALLLPTDIPNDFNIKSAKVNRDGLIEIKWSHKLFEEDKGISFFHTGWLYQTGFNKDIKFSKNLQTQIWESKEFQNIKLIDGEKVFDDYNELYNFLSNILIYGIAIVRNLKKNHNTIERFANLIGTVRGSDFGNFFDVKTKKDANSNAYTSNELKPHNDLSTREYIPGIQFLFCLKNSVIGGESSLCDGFAIAQEIRKKDKKIFNLLSTHKLDFINKSQFSDHRFSSPIFNHNSSGQLKEVRWTNWLRAPLRGSLKDMEKINNAQRLCYQLSDHEKFKVEIKLNPGEMICFDNRRILHGRTAFDSKSGERWLRGCYMEREEIWSAIRILERKKAL